MSLHEDLMVPVGGASENADGMTCFVLFAVIGLRADSERVG